MSNSLNFSERCAVNATSARDLNPGAHVLCTVDGAFSPMRPVAFGDINPDRIADLPLIFADAAVAENRAEHWNERMPEQYRPQLEICAMPIEAWCESFMNALDPGELFDEATSVAWEAPEVDTHPESAALVAENAYDEETD